MNKNRKEMPKVNPKDWLLVNNALRSVVCSVYPNTISPNVIEIVYIDRQGKAINEHIKWENEEWHFIDPDAGYADHYDRLKDFVAILRKDNPLKIPKAPKKGQPHSARSSSRSRISRGR